MPELGHVVFYVRDVARSVEFYRDVVGFGVVGHFKGIGTALSGGSTHHELLLLQVGDAPGPATGRRIGLYHIGIKVGESDDDLRDMLLKLEAGGIELQGASDHTVTHSLYIADPDGNEVELYVDVLPREAWENDPQLVMSPVRPLQL